MQATNIVPVNRIVLYYQGHCAQCRVLSKIVVVMSFYFIKRIPLERDESIKIFYEVFPKAQGYPILFLGSRPVYNYWVFPAVPVAVVLSWYYSLKLLLTPKRASIQ
jgi:hypothetical protein